MPSPPAISRTSAEPTLYEILSLTPKRLEGQAIASQQKLIKQAYHKALLKHHPDKNPQDPSSSSSPPPPPPPPPKPQSKASSVPKSHLTYTVDQIQHAYGVLSNARQRREYDRQLLLTSSSVSASSVEQRHSVSTRFHHTGVETVDLDDLGFDERTGVYFGACRCGNARGFQFTEDQLAEYEEDLVLMVQCLDCSLWMRVLFDAAEEEEEDGVEDIDEPSQQPHPNATPHRPTGSSHHSTAVAGQNRARDAAERRGSGTVSRSGKGWAFNLSFNFGVSLGGSGSATASRT